MTIDGPAGSGKTTISRMLAERDGFVRIDTGAVYRSVGYLLGERPMKKDLDELGLEIDLSSGFRVLHHGKDMERYIRNEKVSYLSSVVGRIPCVREYVNSLVRGVLVGKGRYVIDGRDAGSVIFPEANVKVFLTASVEIRAMRRARELGVSVTPSLVESVRQRDIRDMTREIAPLVKPEGAVEIDTSELTLDEVYRRVKKVIEGDRWR